jgi:uncharacterized protein (DUF924 family)
MPESDQVAEPQDVLSFWFDELSDRDWFSPTAALDAQIFRRFRVTHLSLSRQVGPRWRAEPSARLAAIIVLDQLPRNMYRGSPLAFATDGIARREARLALEAGADQLVHARQRTFFYLPFEHSEEIEDQHLCCLLFSKMANPELLDYAHRHRDIIARFGRFPHRNGVLGRLTSDAESEFLQEPGSRF